VEILQNVWLLVGIVLIVLGRKLYWFSVGALGFVAGMYFVPRFIQVQDQWVTLVIALFAGLLMAILAYVLQRLAISIVGFLVGGYLMLVFLDWLKIDTGNYYWIALILGGIIGAIFASILFDWTLIILSSIVGSVLVVQNLPFDLQTMIIGVIFIVLTLVGVAIQSAMLSRR